MAKLSGSLAAHRPTASVDVTQIGHLKIWLVPLLVIVKAFAARSKIFIVGNFVNPSVGN
jgi:hypothetical protein